MFIALVFVVLREGFSLYYNVESHRIRVLVLGALLGLITYFAHGLLNNYSEFDKIAIPMWGFIAILVAVRAYHMKQIPAEEG